VGEGHFNTGTFHPCHFLLQSACSLSSDLGRVVADELCAWVPMINIITTFRRIIVFMLILVTIRKKERFL
jgi:hypothetical protein